MEMDMVERVARAIDSVQIGSRYNDWTSDRVEGMPIEVFISVPDDDPVIIARFAGRRDECGKRGEEVARIRRAMAAIEAMREPTQEMKAAGGLALATEFTDPWDVLSPDEERIFFGEETAASDDAWGNEACVRMEAFAEPVWLRMVDAALKEHEEGK